VARFYPPSFPPQLQKPALAGERTIWQALLTAPIPDHVHLFYNRRPKGSHRAPDILWLTPGEDCEALIVRAIAAAAHAIHVQAYSFTDEPIARALEDASHRNLKVIVLLDKKQRTQRSSVAHELVDAGLQVLFDDHPAIAHNKTIIIDPESPNSILETGSFNFTYSAENRNAENVLIVRDDQSLTTAYERYFQQRLAASDPW
jgi:phospholipase D